MGAHAKTAGDGLVSFFLDANAALAAPPPGLVNVRAVRGVEQADDAVVYVAGQLALDMLELVALAEHG